MNTSRGQERKEMDGWEKKGNEREMMEKRRRKERERDKWKENKMKNNQMIERKENLFVPSSEQHSTRQNKEIATIYT